MNDFAKQRIIDRLLEAMEREKLTKAQATELFQFKHTNYLSWASKPANWHKCPVAAWEVMRDWTNSGLTIRQFTKRLREEREVLKLEEGPVKTAEEIRKDRQEDQLRAASRDVTHDDSWFESITWCIARARERGLDVKVTITKLEKP